MREPETHNGYLLTRAWRDTAAGLELSLWLATNNGPVRVVIDAQEAVCFIERGQSLQLPAGVRRVPLDLTLLGGEPVDALYCRQQRQLKQLRQQGVPLAESDIKPADRFLMERFIRAGIRVTGQGEPCGPYRQLRQPALHTASVVPDLTAMAIDIETRGGSGELYSIAGAMMPADRPDPADAVAASDAEGLTDTVDATVQSAQPASHAEPAAAVFMIGDGPTTPRDGYTLYYVADETRLLNAFFDWLAICDPDVLIGWAIVNFDLSVLERACQRLRVPFRMARAGEGATILQPGNPGSPRVARIPGRAVLDGIDQLKAGFWSFDSFSLENVANELLGTGKLITPEQNKVAEINRLFQTDKPSLADYNLRDCTLVNDIFKAANLLAFAVQRANLTGLALDRLGGSVAAFDNLYLPLLHRRGFVAPDVNHRDDAPGSPGGYVMDSVPGLYHNVLVLDFKSLYPSIIRTFFIDPMGLANPGDDPVPGFVGARFSRQHHILPGLIEELWAARDTAKQTRNAPLSQAIKIIMNSFYGVLGTTGCRFYSQQLASSITRRGHEIITESRDWIEQTGYRVIYGDTDSLFVLLGEGEQADACHAIGARLTRDLNHWWQTRLRAEHALESQLEVEYETLYRRFLMPTVRGMPTGSKKRYAGLVDTSHGEPQLVVKGLEAARTDWTPLARNFQRELFRRVFMDLPVDDYVRETAERLLAGELDEELIYRKRLRRKVADYQRNVPPHVQAARKLQRPGSWVRYVITRNGPEPVEALASAPDYQHYLDRQLAPAADGILQFLDSSFSAITDAQLQMF